MGPTALLPLRRKACWGFFALKNPTASAGYEPTNLGTSRPSKPLGPQLALHFHGNLSLNSSHTQSCYSEGELRNITLSFSSLQRWNSPKYWGMWEVNSGGFISEKSPYLLNSDPAFYSYTRSVVCEYTGQVANLNLLTLGVKWSEVCSQLNLLPWNLG
jgi:hypothetical protein